MLNLMLLLDLIDISILERGEFSKTIEQPIAKRNLLHVHISSSVINKMSQHCSHLLFQLKLFGDYSNV